ncbi:aminoglycoside adenylyltransferase domain-containing protein [Kitasatospora sp. NPDC056327]|uniref:nucleotidyltransferase domain-containing protein n=1 Tax=Kitasatospora sp. NPDC056327 TaxID=3345785 RepID=UPI0035DD3CCD
MNRADEDGRPLPAELRGYLAELVRRVLAVCGADRVVSVLAAGSVALGDYRHGRSDVDVVVVLAPGPPAGLPRDLARELAHPRLPCPAAGLELVVYDAESAGRPSGAAGHLLNLNTGARLPERADLDGTGPPAFWFVLDRSIVHRAGIALWGAPARRAVAEPAPADLRAALRASVREHAEGGGHAADDRVLNGCRAVLFARTGRWCSKRSAGRLLAAAEPGFRPLLEAALRGSERPRTAGAGPPPAEVRAFLAWAGEELGRN